MQNNPVLTPSVERAGFALLLTALVTPVWSLSAFLTQDGPSHVYNAFLLFHLNETPFRDHFTLGALLQPTWLSQLILGGLVHVFSPVTADKLVATACLLIVPLSFRYFLRQVEPSAPRSLSWASIPFAASHALYMGFWNFCLGYGVSFLALAQFWRFWQQPSARGGAFLGGIAFLLAVCHPVPVAVFLLVIANVILYDVVTLWMRASPPAWPAELMHRSGWLGLWLLPAVTFFAVSSVHRGGISVWRPFWSTLRELDRMWTLVVHSRFERWPAAIVAITIAIAVATVLWRRRRANGGDAWLVAALVVLAAYFLAPDTTSGGDHLAERLLLFPWPLAVVWIAHMSRTVRAPAWLGPVVASTALVLLGLRWPVQRRLDEMLVDYRAAAAHVPQGATVLHISLVRGGIGTPEARPSLTLSPFVHAIGYQAVERRLIDLQNYEARTSFFPVVARPATLEAISRFSQVELPGPACVELSGPGDLEPDAVLVFGRAEAGRLCPELEAELNSAYALAHSAGEGRALLYLRRRR